MQLFLVPATAHPGILAQSKRQGGVPSTPVASAAKENYHERARQMLVNIVPASRRPFQGKVSRGQAPSRRGQLLFPSRLDQGVRSLAHTALHCNGLKSSASTRRECVPAVLERCSSFFW